jgi:hypothetical protein
MFRCVFLLALSFVSFAAFGQSPVARSTYEDRSGTTGHTLTVDGKSFGPYKEVTSVTHSTSGSALLFLVTKREKTYVVAQGREWGPLGPDQDVDQSWISDDGMVWGVTTVKSNADSDVSETRLWVNGKVYGPFEGAPSFDYAEAGGHWLAAVQLGEDNYDVLFDGRSKGPFKAVVHSWLFPDGKSWGWAVTDNDDQTTVETQDKTYSNVQSTTFDQMYPRDPHWAYGIRVGDEQELIVVDGKSYPGYLNFSGIYTTYSGKHWGFTADKMSDTGDFPVVVIDGKEYVGEGLNTTILGDRELFTWTVTDGTKVSLQVLTLP